MQPEDPRRHYWMLSRWKLMEATGVQELETGLRPEQLKNFLTGGDSEIATAVGELCLANKLPRLHKKQAIELIAEQLMKEEPSGMKTAWVGVCARWSMAYDTPAMRHILASSWGFCEPLKRLREMQASGKPIRRHGVPDRSSSVLFP